MNELKHNNTADRELQPAEVQQRLRELRELGMKGREAWFNANPNNVGRGGLWFPEQYLSDELKEEWRALQKMAKGQQVNNAT